MLTPQPRHWIAAGLALLAGFSAWVAFRVPTELYLNSLPMKSSSQTFQDVWFTADDALVGVNRFGSHLEIDRWAQGSEAERRWDVELTGADRHISRRLWTISADLKRVAWIGGAALHIQDLGGTPIVVLLPRTRRALTVTVLSDGSVAAVFDDAAVMRWNQETGRQLDDHMLALSTADHAAADGDYIAVASAADRKAVLFRFREGWQTVDTAWPPELEFDVLMPARGVLATVAQGKVRIGGQPVGAPGAVRSITLFRGLPIVSGDFPNIRSEGRVVTDAPAGSLAVAGRDRLAVARPDGTRLLGLRVEERLTPAHRAVATGAAVLLGLSGLVPLLPKNRARLVHSPIAGVISHRFR